MKIPKSFLTKKDDNKAKGGKSSRAALKKGATKKDEDTK